MKTLCGARFVKYNLLWSICNLARRVSCWSSADDRRLRHLISYLHHMHNETLQSFIGDHANDFSIMLWVDVSLADDLRDSKSTSAAYLVQIISLPMLVLRRNKLPTFIWKINFGLLAPFSHRRRSYPAANGDRCRFPDWRGSKEKNRPPFIFFERGNLN